MAENEPRRAPRLRAALLERWRSIMSTSKGILRDLGKLNPKIREPIQRPAGAPTGEVKGASRVVPAIDMAKKIGAHHTDTRPRSEMPRGAQKPPANWPRNPMNATSGKARAGRLGSMP